MTRRSVLPMPPLSQRDRDRFWSHVEMTADCWKWTGQRLSDGRGRMGIAGTQYVAPRLAWVAVFGSIPAGRFVLHNCDNPSCVRPDHLYVGTHADNQRDAVERGQWNQPRIPRLTGLDHYLGRRTACKNAHEFSPENTRHYRGARVCLTCEQQRHKKNRRSSHGRDRRRSERRSAAA